MKLIPAEDLREIRQDSDEDAISSAIRKINARLKLRHAAGETSALIGFDEKTCFFAKLSRVDREEIVSALRQSGYKVTQMTGEICVRIDWSQERED